MVRQALSPGSGRIAHRLGRGACGARWRVARDQVAAHSAARTGGAHRWTRCRSACGVPMVGAARRRWGATVRALVFPTRRLEWPHAARSAGMLQFLTGELIVFVIRAPARSHYSSIIKELIMTTSSFVGGGS